MSDDPHKAPASWSYSSSGTGARSVIWLHGWGQTAQSLARLAGQLNDIGQHRLFDQPGFGNTPMLRAGASTADYARALLANLPEGKHLIIGHSFGARVAIQLAALAPERVEALVFIAGAGLKRKRSLRQRLRAFGLKLLGKLARLADKITGGDAYARYAERFGSADYRAAGALRPTFVSVVNEDLAPVAARIMQKTLLLYGALDTETPPEFGDRFAKLIPASQFHLVEGFGHLDILDKGAYQCEAYIRRFLSELETT